MTLVAERNQIAWRLIAEVLVGSMMDFEALGRVTDLAAPGGSCERLLATEVPASGEKVSGILHIEPTHTLFA